MADYDGMEIDIDDDGADTFSIIDHRTKSLKSKSPESEDTAGSIKSIPADDIEAVLENDRRYANRSYILPSDEAEEIRSSIMHQVYLAALSGHLTFHRVCPMDKILEIGAGSGDWAIAMAEKYPDCEITATDIWPFQPAGVPPNLIYEIDDARLKWDFLEEFDYIHMRGLSGAFEDWQSIYKQMYAFCSDRGAVEVADFSLISYGVGKVDSALEDYNRALKEAAAKASLALGLSHLSKEALEVSNLRVFRDITIEVPIGTWHPDSRKASLGKLALVAMLEGLEAQSLRLLTRHLGWPAEEVRNLCERVKSEIMTGNLKPSMSLRIMVAKRQPSVDMD